jgi:hypothetical protein
MTRLPLAQVTLCAVDTHTPALAVQALLRSMRLVQFGRVLLFTHGWVPRVVLPEIEVVEIDPLPDAAALALFMRRHLPGYVRSSHALLTRWDASVIHPAAWNDEFLVHDYVGAPWPGEPAGHNVGEGGFSLRSRRFLLAGQDPRLPDGAPEDRHWCVSCRGALEQLHGVSFAPQPLAERFATLGAGTAFGAVGAWHLPAVMSEPEMLECLHRLPPDFFASTDATRLLRALARRGMPQATRTMLRQCEAAGHAAGAGPLLAAASSVMGMLSH